MRDFQYPGRSPVYGGEAMVATPNPQASLVAINILRDGGNAVDAAVAAAALLSVIEPHQTGIGGDCFALYSPNSSKDVVGFNGSGRAPAAATLDWYKENQVDEISNFSPHSVTIPGSIDAWHRLVKDYGSRSLEELLQPAIRCAEEGYIVHSRVAFDWAAESDRLLKNTEATNVFLNNKTAPSAGSRHAQPQLAKTLKHIGKYGREGFYSGEVAEGIVETLRALGGLHTLEDFETYQGDYVKPISTMYRGHEVLQIPPNTQGIIALLMLNIMQGFNLSDIEATSALRHHLEIEAGRLAYHERNMNLADLSSSDGLVERLLSTSFADELRGKINFERCMNFPIEDERKTSDTVYLTVVDKDRNVISLINSLFHSFGSCILSPKSGVLLHNRGASFSLDPDHPNCIAPRKRPMHTIMPSMVLRNRRPVMPFGVMGGDYQPFGHVRFLTNLIDFGCDPQEALDMGRVFHDGRILFAERSISAVVLDQLRSMGHENIEAPGEPLGGGQAISIDWEKGILMGASDGRMDGCALGY